MSDPILTPEAKEAVHTARDAAQAVEVARQVQAEKTSTEVAEKAAVLAAEKIQQRIVDEGRMREITIDSMEHVLSRGTEQDKALILARVPYICQDIKTIRTTLEKMEQTLVYIPLIQRLVFGIVAMVLISVTGALIALVVVR